MYRLAFVIAMLCVATNMIAATTATTIAAPPPPPWVLPSYQLQVGITIRYTINITDLAQRAAAPSSYILWLRGDTNYQRLTRNRNNDTSAATAGAAAVSATVATLLGVPLQLQRSHSNATGDDEWTTTLYYNSSHCGMHVQLRVALAPLQTLPASSSSHWNTREWFDMTGANFVLLLPASPRFVHDDHTTAHDNLDAWPNITFVPSWSTSLRSQRPSTLIRWDTALLDATTSTLPQRYHGNRSMMIYVPPSWSSCAGQQQQQYCHHKPYRVLLVSDSELLTQLADSFDALATNTSRMDEHIAIAPIFASNDERLNLSTPVRGWVWDDTAAAPPRQLGGDADAFINWLVDAMIPQALDYLGVSPSSTSFARQHAMGIIGSDGIGGLLACHAVWMRPDRITGAACDKPSLWWPLNSARQPQYHFLNVTVVTNITGKPLSSYGNMSMADAIRWRPSTSIYASSSSLGASGEESQWVRNGVSRLANLLPSLGTHKIGRDLFIDNRAATTTSDDVNTLILPLLTLWPARGDASLPPIDIPHSNSSSSHSELWTLLSISLVALLILIPLWCVNLRRSRDGTHRATTTLPAGFKRGAARERLLSVSSVNSALYGGGVAGNMERSTSNIGGGMSRSSSINPSGRVPTLSSSSSLARTGSHPNLATIAAFGAIPTSAAASATTVAPSSSSSPSSRRSSIVQ